MAKKPTKRKKAAVSRKSYFRASKYTQLIIILAVALAAVIAVFITKKADGNDSYSGARQTADNFSQAFINCNFKTAQTYYLPFLDENSDISKAYKQECVKDGTTLTFDKQISAATKKVDGVETKNVSYLYDYQNPASHGQILMDLVWQASTNKWVILQLGEPTPPTTNK